MTAIERVISYLQGELVNVRISHSVPANRKELLQLICVSRAGGNVDKFLDEPRLVIDCYAESSELAYKLAMTVVGLIDLMPDSDEMVSAITSMSMYRNEWIEDGSPCYSISCSMIINK